MFSGIATDTINGPVVTMTTGDVYPLRFAPPRRRYLHSLSSETVRDLPLLGYSAATSASGGWSDAMLTGPSTIYALRSFVFSSDDSIEMVVAINEAIAQARAAGLRGLRPGGWLTKLPLAPPAARALVFQGPVWARSQYWGPAQAVDAKSAYPSAAQRLSGQGLTYGRWRWWPRSESIGFGVLPVRTAIGVFYPATGGGYDVLAVIPDYMRSWLERWGRLEPLSVQSVSMPTIAPFAVPELLRKAAYVQWWGSMVARGGKMITPHSHGHAVLCNGDLIQHRHSHGRRLLWGAAISWAVAIETSCLAASLALSGARPLATHIDCVIVRGLEPVKHPPNWRVKESGIYRIFGPGTWDVFSQEPQWHESEPAPETDRPGFRRLITSAAMLSKDDAARAVRKAWSNGHAIIP